MNIGEKIKEIIDQRGMSTSEFARRLCTTNQNVHNIYKRDSLDTKLLERISEILEHDFFQYYANPASFGYFEKKRTRVLVEIEIDDDLKKSLRTQLLQALE